MIDKIRTIKNPLTIIAIFAASAEISGTVILPFISEENQSTYIWFLMTFPLLLVILFFLTLNFNHKVLYAPSDFKNEENFFKFFGPPSQEELNEKQRMEAQESESIEMDSADIKTSLPNIKLKEKFYQIETRVVNLIAEKLGKSASTNVKYMFPSDKYIFDGVIIDDNNFTLIEVKYFTNPDPGSIYSQFKHIYHDFLRAAENLSEEFEEFSDLIRCHISLIFAITTTDITKENEIKLLEDLKLLIRPTPYKIDIQIFRLDEIENELKSYKV
jgi:hypothetical protein